jgi:hypothetical protein
MNTVPSPIGDGVISADPTLFILISWGLSAVVLGGLVLHAIREWRQNR